MLTCREMSELSSVIMESHLSLSNRWAVFMHLRMCSHCTLYLKQLKLTAQVLQKLPMDKQPVDGAAIIKQLNLSED
jgi:hypothetical protein